MSSREELDEKSRSQLAAIFSDLIQSYAIRLGGTGLAGGKWRLANGLIVSIRIKQPRAKR